jgi:hypothetical protein
MQRSRPEQNSERAGRRSSLGWPIGIAVGLLLMILVNLAFIFIAVRGADEVVPSYQTEPR